MHRLFVISCIAVIALSLPFALLPILSQQEQTGVTVVTPEPVPYIPQQPAATTEFQTQQADTQLNSSPQPQSETPNGQTQVLGKETTNKQTQPPAAGHFTQDSLYLLINAHRKDLGLGTLARSTELEVSAQMKIDDMIAQNYWQHADPQNIESWPLFRQAGSNYLLAGENLSFAINSPWGVFSSWVASPTHNEQLLTADYSDMGAAIDCVTYQALADAPCIVVLHLGKK